MPYILPTSASETISLCSSAQSAETLQNASKHTERKRRFVEHKHDRSAVLFFTIYGWKQEDICLLIILIICVYGQTSIIQISGVFLLLSRKINAHVQMPRGNLETVHHRALVLAQLRKWLHRQVCLLSYIVILYFLKIVFLICVTVGICSQS